MAERIDFVPGLPPDLSTDGSISGKTNIVMRNSMPLVKIYPGEPHFTEGLSLFRRIGAFGQSTDKGLSYAKLLSDHGFYLQQPGGDNSKDGGYLALSFLADSFPTDSFTNEYGENFLQKFTDVASEGAASISQMMGARDVGQATRKLAQAFRGGGTISNLVATGIEKSQEAARELIGGISRAIPGAGRGVDLISSLSAGSRIDFPMVWKTSGFQPSYTMTIRLYNPNPASERVTNKFIIGPIAAIMLLGIPLSKDGNAYSWPFIHRIQSPGIFDLDPAFISNITIIKGGDQQQISYQQRLSIVDVRIDFGSLFSSMLAAKGLGRNRPTLEKYLNTLRGYKDGVQKFSTTGQTQQQIDSRQSVRVAQQQLLQQRNDAPTYTEVTDQEKQNPPDRVTQSIQNIANNLISQIPDGLKISF
jgi:hypothetical protein